MQKENNKVVAASKIYLPFLNSFLEIVDRFFMVFLFFFPIKFAVN